jgi:hypothetical protein
LERGEGGVGVKVKKKKKPLEKTNSKIFGRASKSTRAPFFIITIK